MPRTERRVMRFRERTLVLVSNVLADDAFLRIATANSAGKIVGRHIHEAGVADSLHASARRCYV